MYYCILAGGKSRRMGRDKALLELDGHNCAEVLLEQFGAEGDGICLSVAYQSIEKKTAYMDVFKTEIKKAVKKDRESSDGKGVMRDIIVIEDKVENAGPLGAIYSLLSELRQDIFVVAVDMPFANARLAGCLMDIGRKKSDSEPQMIILERSDKKREMLFGYYSYSCLAAIREMLSSGCLRLSNLCDKVNCIFVSEAEISAGYGQGWEIALFNMNRPEDYAFALNKFSQIV